MKAPALIRLAACGLLVAGAVHGALGENHIHYPRSPVIREITFDVEHLQRSAPGSDLWPMAWADDDQLYTSWGDGGGFGGTDSIGRVFVGIARVSGPATHFTGTNILGGFRPEVPAKPFPGKSNGILCIGGVLYLHLIEQGHWWRSKIGRSTDHGRKWMFNEGPFDPDKWEFAEEDGAFADMTFLTFGKDYQGARDEFVYVYSQDKRRTPDGKIPDLSDSVAMFRAPSDKLMDRRSYEFFAGLDIDKHTMWTKQIDRRKPVFENPGHVGFAVRVAYLPALRRYVLTMFTKMDGSWGVYDAPEPWGPWTTAATFDRWIDATPKFGFTFPAKWMSDDGKNLYMVFSGTGKYDAFNVVKGTIRLRK